MLGWILKHIQQFGLVLKDLERASIILNQTTHLSGLVFRDAFEIYQLLPKYEETTPHSILKKDSPSVVNI